MIKIAKTALFLHVLLMLLSLACSISFSSSPSSPQDSPRKNPLSASVPSSGGDGSRESIIRIPSSPQIAPADVLDQVVFEGTGGAEGGWDGPNISESGNMITLYGFRPGQRIRLVAYHEYEQGYANYYADWILNVDSSGSLAISVTGADQPGLTFVVLDINTSELLAPRSRPIFSCSLYNSCQSSQSTQSARISSEVTEVNLRTSPGYSNKNDATDVIARIPSGTTVDIIGGPSSADELTWYQVSWNGYTGWVAEKTGSGRTILIFTP